MGQSAADIHLRFADERDQILEYVDLISTTTWIDDFAIREINGKLIWAGLPTITTRAGDRLVHHYSQEELAKLLASFDVVQLKVEEYVKTLVAKLDVFQKSIKIVQNCREEVNAWKEFFVAQCLTDLKTEEEQAEFAEKMIQQFPIDRFTRNERDLNKIRPAADMNELAKRREYIGQALINGQNNATSTLAYHHQEILKWIARTRSVSKLIADDAPVNLLRQAFLLLMTAFDTAIFDLVRVALRGRFFQLISKIGKSVTLKVDQFYQHASIDSTTNHPGVLGASQHALPRLRDPSRRLGKKLTDLSQRTKCLTCPWRCTIGSSAAAVREHW